jgi:hypothetical protein
MICSTVAVPLVASGTMNTPSLTAGVFIEPLCTFDQVSLLDPALAARSADAAGSAAVSVESGGGHAGRGELRENFVDGGDVSVLVSEMGCLGENLVGDRGRRYECERAGWKS